LYLNLRSLNFLTRFVSGFPDNGRSLTNSTVSMKIPFESIAETVSLLVEVRNCLISLGFGRPKKANPPHFVRALRAAKTCSAGIASILPAL
jgi:hypothetical protein